MAISEDMSEQDLDLMKQLGVDRFTGFTVAETEALMKRAVEIGAKPYVVPGTVPPECGYSRIPLMTSKGIPNGLDWVGIISADGKSRINFEVNGLFTA